MAQPTMSEFLDFYENSKKRILKSAAIAGLGITRLLSFQVNEEVQQKRLNLLFSDQLPPGLVVQAVFTHQRNLSPRVRVLLEFLTTYCAKILV